MKIFIRSLIVAAVLGIAVLAVCVTAKADGPICFPNEPCNPGTMK